MFYNVKWARHTKHNQSMNKIDAYLKTDVGKLAAYGSRRRRRLYVRIDSIEPQSKKMSAADQDRFQELVIEQLSARHRTSFRGDIALGIHISTTHRNPPQAHTITKNLLDLLGLRRPTVVSRRKYIMYRDDSQIQALAVSCRHGAKSPQILIEARPLNSALEDLRLAEEATREDQELDFGNEHNRERERESIDTFKDLLVNEHFKRRQLGNRLYNAYFKMCRWEAQRALLARTRVEIPMLCWMYDRSRTEYQAVPTEVWANYIAESRLRLQVGELPIEAGSSREFKRRISDEIRRFQKQWNWIVDPLVVPVALEVVVRPNPATPADMVHDLDNIVRDYLLPQIVPSFGTISDVRWAIDFQRLQMADSQLIESWDAEPVPPKGTRAGVTRYEVWRLAAVEGTSGFVSVALVGDMDGEGDVFRQVDERIEKWSSGRMRYGGFL